MVVAYDTTAILPHNNALQLAPGLAIFGVGLGACSILPDLVQSSAPAEQISDAAGLANSFSYFGQSLVVRSAAWC